MGIEDTILAQYKVKIIKHEPDGMSSLCGEKMQIADGKHFFEIPAGFAQYYKEMYPKWTVSDPYIPEKNKPKSYVAEEKPVEYKYACTKCGFKCNSAQVLEVHPCTHAKPEAETGDPIPDRIAEKNRRIDALIEQDKADRLNTGKKKDARFGKRTGGVYPVKNVNKISAPNTETPQPELEEVKQ